MKVFFSAFFCKEEKFSIFSWKICIEVATTQHQGMLSKKVLRPNFSNFHNEAERIDLDLSRKLVEAERVIFRLIIFISIKVNLCLKLN